MYYFTAKCLFLRIIYFISLSLPMENQTRLYMLYLGIDKWLSFMFLIVHLCKVFAKFENYNFDIGFPTNYRDVES